MSFLAWTETGATGAEAPLPSLLLSYTISPQTIPCSSDLNHPVTANLRIGLTNGTNEAIRCAAIAFVLPVGPGAGELTTSPGAISASPVEGTTWTIAPDARTPGGFQVNPPSGGGLLAPHASLAFELSGVLVNGAVGTVALAAYEASDFASAPAAPPTKRQGSLLLTKVNTGLAIRSFTAAPWSVTAGQPCVLSWQTSAAESCVLSWDGENHAVPTSGTQTVAPTLTTPYTLTAIGGGGAVTSQIAVSVPVQVSFSGPKEPVKIGGPATLGWEIKGALMGTLSPVEGEREPLVAPVGRREVHPTETTTYTLAASSPGGGTVTQSVTVVVDPVPLIDAFAFERPASSQPGEPLTLTWRTQHGRTVTIDQGIGEVPPCGSMAVQPAANTCYTLTCTNLNGPVTRAAWVPVRASLTGPSEAVKSGGPATVSWQIEGATTGTLAPVESGQAAVVEPVGSREVHPTETMTYSLTASSPGTGGTVSVPVTVVVDPLPRIDQWKVEESTTWPAMPGTAFTLTWSTQHGQRVTIDQGIGAVEASGSLVVHPMATTTYTLTCENHNGPVSMQVTIPVTRALGTRGPSSDGSGAQSAYWTVYDMVRYEVGFREFLIRGTLPAGKAVVELEMSPWHDVMCGRFFDAEGRMTACNVIENQAPVPPVPAVDNTWPQIRKYLAWRDTPDAHCLLGWKFVGAAKGVLNPNNIEVGPTGEYPFHQRSGTKFILTVTGAAGETVTAAMM